MNVTDVGHLKAKDDAGADESGEDKMEIAAKRENKTAKEIADFYFNEFKQGLLDLNLTEPTIWCKATEYIKEQIEMIKINRMKYTISNEYCT